MRLFYRLVCALEDIARALESIAAGGPGRMQIAFEERNTMPLIPQAVSVHPDAIYDIIGSATLGSGEAVTLTNLSVDPSTSAVGAASTGEDAGDDADVLDTAGVSVGATASLMFSADGDNGKKYQAAADVTVVAVEEPENFTLTFTERP